MTYIFKTSGFYCFHEQTAQARIISRLLAGYKNKKPPVIQREASLTKYKLNELTQIYNLKTKNTIYFNKKSQKHNKHQNKRQ